MLSTPRVLTAAYVVVGGALVLLTVAYPLTAMVVASWAALLAVARVFGPLAVSPALIVAGGLAAVGLVGRLLYPLVVDVPYATGIEFHADPELLDRGFYALTGASLAVSVGALAVGLFTRRPGGRVRLRAVRVPRRARDILTVASLVPPVALILMRGVTELLERSTYRYEGLNSGLAGALTSALIVTLVIGGYLLGTQRLAGRALVLVSVLTSTGYLLALGSRMFAAIPVLLAVGYYMARMNRRSFRVLLLGLVVTLLLVPLPLYWRTLDTHGLLPYLASLGGYGESDFGWGTTAKTILISVPITGASAVKDIPGEALRVALDPRPGRFAGWYEMYPHLMLNPFSPTSGVGELLNHGAGVLATVCLVIGVYLGFLDRHMRQVLRRGHHLVAFAHAGLISLCVVYLVQYHLRIGMRMLLYSAALWAAYTLWRWARKRRRIAVRAHYPYASSVSPSAVRL